jgi:predicted O-linked N-acetylglucosamine transferase (SPINDLY family)
MGVPVVTVRGERHAARVGASILTMTGLQEWIADSVDDYVQRCVGLAGRPDYLKETRQQLRQRMQHSGLCDGGRFTRNLEAAILELLPDTTP